ncbi:uncharacterized protein ColSpa_06296 [Colletotrichum spaethianum]|uniref:Xylanolytic transcriptional activator regulatory domain-containing protein n=1 Tax=Colletotrichum spaethianum TaxID=700344 RepID=A0AA37P0X7_9PEZI|nr:uncharacterized protein ColSpa_06296 [Colletotrichum spaethianum]GKT46115.1 hypothetical protein ColSpa_06296 [Colletotrichum spaethianum]
MPPTGMPMQSSMSPAPAPTTMDDTLDFSTPGSQFTMDKRMRLQLQRIYFEQFHPQWPLLHREVFETTAQPKLLMQAVMAVGLWFAESQEFRDLAIEFHDHLLIETGNKLATLISTILVPYRADKSMDNIMMTHAMLLETFKATGVYDQSKINAGSRLCGHNGYPWVFRELYQR